MSASLPPEPAGFPIFLRLDGVRVVVVGGGTEAVAKTRLLLPSGARVCVVAELPDGELHALAVTRRITLIERALQPADLTGARLCVVALENDAAAAAAVAMARSTGVLVNAVDRPELCDFIVPAIVDRAPVSIAIGTGGSAPALARDVRTMVEAAVPLGIGALAELCRRWRGRVRDALPNRAARRHFWDGSTRLRRVCAGAWNARARAPRSRSAVPAWSAPGRAIRSC
jgi:uroporphyrin-III C-methyltransferase/precorrin-2 dehydrogenase/sirohydrochlorin ferrochelatase